MSKDNLSHLDLSRDISRPIGERVKHARLAYREIAKRGGKLTQEELASWLEMTGENISQNENGKYDFSRQALVALAKELRCDFGEQWIRDHLRDWFYRMQAVWFGEGWGFNDLMGTDEVVDPKPIISGRRPNPPARQPGVDKKKEPDKKRGVGNKK